MKFKSSILSSVDNLTKGIIVLISFFFKYVKKFNYNVLLFVYVFNRQYLLKRFFFFNFFSFLLIIVVSFFPFFTMLSGELLLFSFPIVFFCIYVLNIFLVNVFIDFSDEIELIEFFVQSLEVCLWSNFKSIYLLFYILYIYRFLLIFVSFYFDNLLLLVEENTPYSWICKIFVVDRYLKFLVSDVVNDSIS
jgi:hypothetical protein